MACCTGCQLEKNLFCIDLNLFRAHAHAIDLPKIQRASLSSSIGVSMGHLCFAQCEYSDFSIQLLEDHNQADGWILKYSISYDYLWECLVVDQFQLHDDPFCLQPYAVHPKSDDIFLGVSIAGISKAISLNWSIKQGMEWLPGCYMKSTTKKYRK